jgi:hypothetical protein
MRRKEIVAAKPWRFSWNKRAELLHWVTGASADSPSHRPRQLEL